MEDVVRWWGTGAWWGGVQSTELEILEEEMSAQVCQRGQACARASGNRCMGQGVRRCCLAHCQFQKGIGTDTRTAGVSKHHTKQSPPPNQVRVGEAIMCNRRRATRLEVGGLLMAPSGGTREIWDQKEMIQPASRHRVTRGGMVSRSGAGEKEEVRLQGQHKVGGGRQTKMKGTWGALGSGMS